MMTCACLMLQPAGSLICLIYAVSVAQGCCTETDDLLPGLVLLSQQWLSEVVYPSFRGAESMSIPLQKWFDHPRVSLNLKVLLPVRSHYLLVCLLPVVSKLYIVLKAISKTLIKIPFFVESSACGIHVCFTAHPTYLI